MHAQALRLETSNLAGRSPDITVPTAPVNDGKGRAILFADVSKSMQMHELLGDNAARVVIDSLLEMATRAIVGHKGRVVKTIGDELLAVMPTADAAARAARDILADIDSCCRPQGGIKPGMHIGLHAGAFIERDGDVFGDAVNVASRLADYAKQGQILTTSVSAGGISPLVRRSMRSLGPLDIRGRQQEIQVEEIEWREGVDEEATYTEAVRELPVPSMCLALSLGEQKWVVGPLAKHLSIGRDVCADIAIASPEASRNHGMIEYRNGGFFYIDLSLNGSYVSFGDTGETLVRRGQILLSGRGVICFGHSVEDPGEPLAFQVDSIEH